MNPLRGKRILVTRARSQAEHFLRQIENAGGIPVLLPTIEVRSPVSWEAIDRAIDGLHMYDGLLFTSANAVDGFLLRCADRHAELTGLDRKRIFAVGEQTKKHLEMAHVPVTAVPEQSTARDLGRLLEEEDLTHRAFLFPCGNLAGNHLADTLRSLGAHVDRAEVYQTVLPPASDVEALIAVIRNDEIDVATFFSPSSFTNFLSLLGQEQTRDLMTLMHVAVIGPTTADAVRRAGFEPTIIARDASAEGLVRAIEEFYTLPRTSS